MPVDCENCGNPVEGSVSTCPFCGSGIAPEAQAQSGPGPLQVVMLKQGMPTLAQAEERFLQTMDRAFLADHRVLVLVHGYGSSGRGGDMRHWVRDKLAQFVDAGRIRKAIHGEKFADDPEARALYKRYPELYRQMPKTGNPGATLVLV